MHKMTTLILAAMDRRFETGMNLAFFKLVGELDTDLIELGYELSGDADEAAKHMEKLLTMDKQVSMPTVAPLGRVATKESKETEEPEIIEEDDIVLDDDDYDEEDTEGEVEEKPNDGPVGLP